MKSNGKVKSSFTIDSVRRQGKGEYEVDFSEFKYSVNQVRKLAREYVKSGHKIGRTFLNSETIWDNATTTFSFPVCAIISDIDRIWRKEEPVELLDFETNKSWIDAVKSEFK